MQNKDIKLGSNRSFGIVFFVVFFIISIYPLINDNPIRLWSLILSLIFLILGLISKKPIKVLRPLTIESSFPNFYKIMIELGANFIKE